MRVPHSTAARRGPPGSAVPAQPPVRPMMTKEKEGSWRIY